MGTLCVMDKTPGNLRYEQKEGLGLLSDQVSNILVQNAGEGEEIALKTNDE